MGRVWRVQSGLQAKRRRPRLPRERYCGEKLPACTRNAKHAHASVGSYATRTLQTRVPWCELLLLSMGRLNQVILKGEHLLQLHMARDDFDAALQYPTRYSAEDNITLEVDIRLNRYIAQTKVRKGAWRGILRPRVSNRCLGATQRSVTRSAFFPSQPA